MTKQTTSTELKEEEMPTDFQWIEEFPPTGILPPSPHVPMPQLSQHPVVIEEMARFKKKCEEIITLAQITAESAKQMQDKEAQQTNATIIRRLKVPQLIFESMIMPLMRRLASATKG